MLFPFAVARAEGLTLKYEFGIAFGQVRRDPLNRNDTKLAQAGFEQGHPRRGHSTVSDEPETPQNPGHFYRPTRKCHESNFQKRQGELLDSACFNIGDALAQDASAVKLQKGFAGCDWVLRQLLEGVAKSLEHGIRSFRGLLLIDSTPEVGLSGERTPARTLSPYCTIH
jgi:hypothetical protein